MSNDISNEPDTIALKTYWQARGVPSNLIDDLIAEANAEYNSTIEYNDVNRFAALTVNLTDNESTPDCVYVVCIVNETTILRGNEIEGLTYMFGQLQCVPVDVLVFKVDPVTDTCKAYGEAQINHSKDESLSITLEALGGAPSGMTPSSIISESVTVTIPYTLAPFKSGIMMFAPNCGFNSPIITETPTQENAPTCSETASEAPTQTNASTVGETITESATAHT